MVSLPTAIVPCGQAADKRCPPCLTQCDSDSRICMIKEKGLIWTQMRPFLGCVDTIMICEFCKGTCQALYQQPLVNCIQIKKGAGFRKNPSSQKKSVEQKKGDNKTSDKINERNCFARFTNYASAFIQAVGFTTVYSIHPFHRFVKWKNTKKVTKRDLLYGCTKKERMFHAALCNIIVFLVEICYFFHMVSWKTG